MNRSEEAQQLLDNKILTDAFSNVRENIVAQLEATPLDAKETMNQLTISLQVLAAIRDSIENEIDLQHLSETELAQANHLN